MRPNNTSPKKPVLASQNIKDMLDNGMTAWKIKKLGVSSKRITKISNGIIPDKRGRKSKFTDAHKDYVIELAKADPRISNKMIRSLFEQNFGFTVSSGKVSEWLHQGKLFYGKPIIIQELKDYQIIARYNFALKMLQLPESFFSHLTFSDESRFCTNPDSLFYIERKDHLMKSIAFLKQSFQLRAWFGAQSERILNRN